MTSRLFSSNAHREIAQRLKESLNSNPVRVSKDFAESTRATGDAIQKVISERLEEILGTDWCAKYQATFGRKAKEDLAFLDHEGYYYAVDVKTHRRSTAFSRPNLISVERLVDFYKDDKHYFVILLVSYDLEDRIVLVHDVTFSPIEYLKWECLAIGALGLGQIQLRDSNTIAMDAERTRKPWMIEFCNTTLEFYRNEIRKIEGQRARFELARAEWEDRAE